MKTVVIISLLVSSSHLVAAPTSPSSPTHAPVKTAVAKPAPPPEVDPNAREPELVLPSGIGVTVLDFDKKTNTFLLSLNESTAVGPNYATPEALHKALGIPGNLRDFENQRPQMIGSIYTLKRPCPLLTETEMDRRQKKARSGERAF